MLAEVRRKVLLEGGLARAPALAGLARRVAARQLVAARFVLADAPELVNSDPYGEGWLFRLRPDAPTEIEELLDNEDYARLLTEFDD